MAKEQEVTAAPAALAPIFVAVGSFAWGKGATVSEAVKQCKRNLSGGKHTVNVMRVIGFKYVSEVNGAINYSAAGSCEQVDTQTVTVR